MSTERLARHIPAWQSLPAAPARHRSPRQGRNSSQDFLFRNCRLIRQFPACRACAAPRSGFRFRSTPRSVFRLRFNFRFCPKNPAEAMRWGAHRFRSWISSRKTHHRASAEGLGAMLSLQQRSQSVFFTIHTPSRQSWRGRRIAHSILA